MKNKAIFRFALILFVVGAMLVGTAGTIAAPLGASENPNINVFVSFDRNPGRAEEGLVRAFGGIVKYDYDIVPAIAASIPESSIQGLLNNPRVTNIELDGTVYAVDAELTNSWGVERIGSGTVHANGNEGAGVKVGIIDSGIDYKHLDLGNGFGTGYKVVGGYDFVNGDPDPMDDYGHGTHVAGIVAAGDNGFGVVGVAPEASLYALKVLDSNGGGYWSDIIAAMEWAVGNGLQVVNLSLGSSRDPGKTVKTAFDNAEAAGLVIVAAAGNSGNTKGKGNNVIYPAKYASVIAVAATDQDDQRASWSSTGDEVEIAAPGVAVLSTWNDDTSPHDPQPIYFDGGYYKEGSGTSMASPHVAGSAALVIASGTTNNNDEVRQALDNTTTDLGDKGRDPLYGFGLVNVAYAVDYTAPTTVTVESITYTTSGGKNHYKDLLITVALVDDCGNTVSGASVSIDLFNDENIVLSKTGTTDSDGTVTFILRNAPSGTYETHVIDVDATGLKWDGLTPTNGFDKT